MAAENLVEIVIAASTGDLFSVATASAVGSAVVKALHASTGKFFNVSVVVVPHFPARSNSGKRTRRTWSASQRAKFSRTAAMKAKDAAS